MANKSKKKVGKRFGIAGGRHSNIRKWVRRKKYSYKYRVPNFRKRKTYSMKLKIVRQQILHKYNIGQKKKCEMFGSLCPTEKYTDIYNIQKINDLRFRMKRIASNEADGYRFISMNKLQDFITTITFHSISCEPLKLLPKCDSTLPPIRFVKQLRQYGLASIFICECQGCRQTFTFETSPQLSIKDTNHYDVNVRSVWGSMATGSGMSSLNELLGTLNSPGISQPTFSKLEQEIGDLWGESVEEELLQAGAEERQIAIEKGNFDEGVPCITVVTDGGWSKRSHRHTYNALGGVAVIIGAETGKLLHIGVRNKHCYICNSAETNHTNPAPHRCFRNWTESSQAMEADIIVDGFLKAESVHGLRYTKFIGDGDSSVFARIQQNVPVWGRRVEKLECANHVCKCLRTSLENLVEQNSYYKGKGRLSRTARMKIVSAVRCAIRLRSKEKDSKGNVRKLDHDIRNTVHHVFGNHSSCSDFCKANAEKSTNSKTDEAGNAESDSSMKQQDIPDVLQEVSDIWQETTSQENEEKSREDCNITGLLDSIMIRDISVLLDRVALKSSRLIGNYTTNLAESWMSIRAKFDGGKIYNRCNRGSWHARCYGGTLRKNLGPQWSTKVWEKSTGSNAGKYFKHLYRVRERSLHATKVSQAKPERKSRRWKRKVESTKESNSKRARTDYGPTSLEAPTEITAEKMEELKHSYIEKHLELTDDRIKAVEVLTRRQSATTVWREERKKRITSSNFGSVCKRNVNIKVKNLVKQLIYPSFMGNVYTRKGIQDEVMSIKEYEARKKEENCPVRVESVGLVISSEHKFLATSPDGRVIQQDGEIGLIEIKNLLQKKPINLYEAAKNTNFCLEFQNGKLHLKTNHDYYYQVQGQLNIMDLPWVDFVVRTEKPYQLHVERINRDRSLWINNMLPKLQAFYYKAVLPELVAPAFNTVSGIREPGCWYIEEKKSTSQQRKRKQQKKTSVCTEDKTPDANPSSNISSVDLPLDSFPPLASSPANKTAASSTLSSTSTLPSSSVVSSIASRSRRCQKVKFVGRRISHQWIEDEARNVRKWYSGIVTSTLTRKDGDEGTVYEVIYDGDDEPYSVDHLLQDYQDSLVKFTDL